jgi:predicted enzyme related to lactoylglutathione lyase
MSHDICHVEIPAPDMAEAKRFYEAVFGWKVELWGDGTYAIFKTSDKGLSGGLVGERPVADGGCVIFLECEDMPAMLEKITANGGKVVLGKTAIGGGEMGYFSYFRDSLGNKLGLWSKT